MNPTTAKLGLCFGMMLPAEGVGAEQWETLFEGTIESTESANDASVYLAMFTDAEFDFVPMFYPVDGATVRLTIDGKQAIYSATLSEGTPYVYHVGNKGLFRSGYTDDGFDLRVFESKLGVLHIDSFFTRTPGTHTVKIERLVS